MTETLSLVLHFADDAARRAWIDRNRDALEAENAKYAETNVGTCSDHPHHACRCTDANRERAKSLREKLLGQALDDDYAMLVGRIRQEIVQCREHPMPLPKPSCWTCGRNGAFERAARIVEAVARVDAGVVV